MPEIIDEVLFNGISFGNLWEAMIEWVKFNPLIVLIALPLAILLIAYWYWIWPVVTAPFRATYAAAWYTWIGIKFLPMMPRLAWEGVVRWWGKCKRSLRNWAKMRLRGKSMSPQKRAKHVEDVITKAITDAIEEAEFKGEITRQEAQHYYRMLGEQCHLKGLLPFHIHVLKTRLKERRVRDGKPLPAPQNGKDKLEAILAKNNQTVN